MFEHLPLHGWNIKIWIFLGFIRNKNYLRASCFMFFPLLVTIGQMLHIVMMWHRLQDHVIGFFMAAILFNAVLRISIVMRNELKFANFTDAIRQWHYNVEKNNDLYAMNTLKKVSKYCHIITTTILVLGVLGVLLTALFPMAFSERKLPYDIYVPGINILESPYYETMYVIQVINVIPFVITTYLPFTNLFLIWLVFGIGMLRDLQFKLLAINIELDTRQKLKQLKQCIIYHNKIIEFRENLENLVSFVCLMEFLLFSVMLCVLLYFILMVNGFILQFTAGTYIVCVFYVICFSYWHANEFSQESLKIADTMYAVNWPDGNREFRQCALIIISRSQNALQIFSGGLYPMTLETFQALLNASYTYFTLLRTFMAKKV